MTRFLEDILRQPEELQRVLSLLNGDARGAVETAAARIRGAPHVYLSGMGASYNAALGAAAHFHAAGCPVSLLDAGELLHTASIPSGSVLVVLSRSGGSVEIMALLDKARAAGATVIGITNFAEGALAQNADLPLLLPLKPDHGISASTYVSLAAGAAAIAASLAGDFDARLVSALREAIAATAAEISKWQQELTQTIWLQPGPTYYFLGRGPSMASALGAQLLWEEGVKIPAAALGTDSFRHGPQEIVAAGMRFGLWVDVRMRDADLAIARDLRRLGAAVMLIGEGLPEDAADLIFQLPRWPAGWQFLMDIIPAQLAAEALARLSGADCDTFRYASYIVQGDRGLLQT
jgi:glucosamine--fructose-6-phosphate aminotransferase (isomerizing)